ncbi:MAG: nucleoside monophosphate kinase [Puniceicoccales bacterium]
MTADTQDNAAPAAESTAPVRDLEIKDTQIIFNSVWNDLEKDYSAEELCFPKEIFWLNGAPGAGKGTHTRTAMRFRDFTEPPIVVSDLLKSPEARKRIDSGLLVGDREVTELVFRALLKPNYQSGAVVDGFPRTKVQVECLKMLYAKLNELRGKHLNTPLAHKFPKPHFHILVLFIEEEESVRRQIQRGEQAIAHNREVEASGVGKKEEVRKTDLDPEAARHRYRIFKEQTYDALQSLRDVFYYHYINTNDTIEKVSKRIVNELKYQSSLELEEATFDRISTIPLASTIIQHARQELVTRLDSYEQNEREIFARVVNLVRDKFMPIIIRHAISGRAIVNSEDEVFDHPLASAMLIDIFSERGFHATVDIQREDVPACVDRETFEIKTYTKRVVRVHISFAGSEIRRG